MSIVSTERAEFTAMMNKASDEIEALRAEVERLKADADRYHAWRMMKESRRYGCPYLDDRGRWNTLRVRTDLEGVDVATFESLNDAIDAAMKADQ